MLPDLVRTPPAHVLLNNQHAALSHSVLSLSRSVLRDLVHVLLNNQVPAKDLYLSMLQTIG